MKMNVNCMKVEDDDLRTAGEGRGGEEQESAWEGGDDGNNARLRGTRVGGGRAQGGGERVQRGIVRMGRRKGRMARERAVASVVEQMRARVAEVGKRYERGEGGGVT